MSEQDRLSDAAMPLDEAWCTQVVRKRLESHFPHVHFEKFQFVSKELFGEVDWAIRVDSNATFVPADKTQEIDRVLSTTESELLGLADQVDEYSTIIWDEFRATVRKQYALMGEVERRIDEILSDSIAAARGEVTSRSAMPPAPSSEAKEG